MKIKISRIDKNLPLPEYHTDGAVAFDIYTREDAKIEPGEVKMLPTNLIIAVPDGYALILASRSSLFKKGLVLRNGIGVIDQDYHGPEDEIRMALYNFTKDQVEVTRGDRLCQGLLIPALRGEWIETDEPIKDDSRGGFGSTS